ncbi:hypothetical protein QCN29_15875 [Streptomyces sp. HNM0663]|uniref:Secreted protein n=1 Tax=Streptomyces chengmaiensis TaxID=3040919 RepID=A0ABT6HPT2_9ACTN|nr:hypothetical protein [Streptomyces chengmaiensis]MDH2390243.1 hypothetical protein [Streptomyces chengmaiensis]
MRPSTLPRALVPTALCAALVLAGTGPAAALDSAASAGDSAVATAAQHRIELPEPPADTPGLPELPADPPPLPELPTGTRTLLETPALPADTPSLPLDTPALPTSP